MRMIVSLLSLLLISGCATLSQTQCESRDWFHFGYLDGKNGRPQGRIDDHREACAEYGIRVNSQDYRRGYNKGVVEYCTPRNGLRVGQRGDYYHGVCPSYLAREFERNYELGHRYYELEQDLNDVDYKIRQLEHKLDDDLPHKEYQRIKAELNNLYDQRRILRRALDALDLPYY